MWLQRPVWWTVRVYIISWFSQVYGPSRKAPGATLANDVPLAFTLQVFRHLHEVHPYWPGADRAIEELTRDVDGRGI